MHLQPLAVVLRLHLPRRRHRRHPRRVRRHRDPMRLLPRNCSHNLFVPPIHQLVAHDPNASAREENNSMDRRMTHLHNSARDIVESMHVVVVQQHPPTRLHLSLRLPRRLLPRPRLRDHRHAPAAAVGRLELHAPLPDPRLRPRDLHRRTHRPRRWWCWARAPARRAAAPYPPWLWRDAAPAADKRRVARHCRERATGTLPECNLAREIVACWWTKADLDVYTCHRRLRVSWVL